jgi:hypothetical protein
MATNIATPSAGAQSLLNKGLLPLVGRCDLTIRYVVE